MTGGQVLGVKSTDAFGSRRRCSSGHVSPPGSSRGVHGQGTPEASLPLELSGSFAFGGTCLVRIRVLENEGHALTGTDADPEHAVAEVAQVKLGGQGEDVTGTR